MGIRHRRGAGDCAKPFFATTTGQLARAPHSGLKPGPRTAPNRRRKNFRARGFGVSPTVVILGLDPGTHSAISPSNVMCGWITEWILGSGAEDDD